MVKKNGLSNQRRQSFQIAPTPSSHSFRFSAGMSRSIIASDRAFERRPLGVQLRQPIARGLIDARQVALGLVDAGTGSWP